MTSILWLRIRGSSPFVFDPYSAATTEILIVLFAYFTPDVALPVASAVAAVFGFIMLVGRTPIRFAAKAFRWAARGMRSMVDKFQI